MYIYNVTTLVAWQVHDAWLPWAKETYIPLVLATGCFTHHRMVQLLDADDTEGPTYAVQFFAEGEAAYQKYLRQHAPGIRRQALQQWGEACISFHSGMKVVH